jgi:hypothetical protein
MRWLVAVSISPIQALADAGLDKTTKRDLKVKQLNAGWDHDYLHHLLAF